MQSIKVNKNRPFLEIEVSILKIMFWGLRYNDFIKKMPLTNLIIF